MISEDQIRVYNKILEPNIWNEDKTIKSDIRLYLLKIAKDFYVSTDFKSEILDILILGSSVNYTWTKESDIDIHIIIDITKEGLDPEHYRKFLDSLSGRFNEEHNIVIKNHKVEVYLQDITEKNSTPEKARSHGAMYSLLHNKWLIEPKFEEPALDKSSIKKAFYEIKDQIDNIIESRNVVGLKKLMKSIRDYRNKGLEGKEGEFSVENIVFKALRHTGLLKKLKDGINSIYDRMVSLEEMDSYLNKLNSLDEDVVHELIEETIVELEERDKPYILIGAVDDKLKVAVIKSEKMGRRPVEYQPFKTHEMLYYGDFDINPTTAIRWRYRSDMNELLYYDYPSEEQSLAVKQYLDSNCKLIAKPTVVMMANATRSHRRAFHDLDYQYQEKPPVEEVFTGKPPIDKNFVVTGMVSHDLDVVGEAYWENKGMITHTMLQHWYGNWGDSVDWRYRHDENKVYWKDKEPNRAQKEAIIDFLKREFKVELPPIFVPSTPANEPERHFPSYRYSGGNRV
jgi:hypothetical protein